MNGYGLTIAVPRGTLFTETLAALDGLGIDTADVRASDRRLLFDEGCDIVTLGMYADTAHGRARYDSLGFADTHHFTSGPLLTRGRW